MITKEQFETVRAISVRAETHVGFFREVQRTFETEVSNEIITKINDLLEKYVGSLHQMSRRGIMLVIYNLLKNPIVEKQFTGETPVKIEPPKREKHWYQRLWEFIYKL